MTKSHSDNKYATDSRLGAATLRESFNGPPDVDLLHDRQWVLLGPYQRMTNNINRPIALISMFKHVNGSERPDWGLWHCYRYLWSSRDAIFGFWNMFPRKYRINGGDNLCMRCVQRLTSYMTHPGTYLTVIWFYVKI